MREALPGLVAIKKSNWGKWRKRVDEDSELGVFRILADGSEQPILITNEAVEIEYVNSAWQKQFGYAFAEVKGENPRMLQSGKTPREVYERMWKALRAERMFQSDEVIDKRRDGTHFNLLTTVFPIRHNGCLFYIQILDDITERKRVEALQQRFTRAGTNWKFPLTTMFLLSRRYAFHAAVSAFFLYVYNFISKSWIYFCIRWKI